MMRPDDQEPHDTCHPVSTVVSTRRDTYTRNVPSLINAYITQPEAASAVSSQASSNQTAHAAADPVAQKPSRRPARSRKRKRRLPTGPLALVSFQPFRDPDFVDNETASIGETDPIEDLEHPSLPIRKHEWQSRSLAEPLSVLKNRVRMPSADSIIANYFYSTFRQLNKGTSSKKASFQAGSSCDGFSGRELHASRLRQRPKPFRPWLKTGARTLDLQSGPHPLPDFSSTSQLSTKQLSTQRSSVVPIIESGGLQRLLDKPEYDTIEELPENSVLSGRTANIAVPLCTEQLGNRKSESLESMDSRTRHDLSRSTGPPHLSESMHFHQIFTTSNSADETGSDLAVVKRPILDQATDGEGIRLRHQHELGDLEENYSQNQPGQLGKMRSNGRWMSIDNDIEASTQHRPRKTPSGSQSTSNLIWIRAKAELEGDLATSKHQDSFAASSAKQNTLGKASMHASKANPRLVRESYQTIAFATQQLPTTVDINPCNPTGISSMQFIQTPTETALSISNNTSSWDHTLQSHKCGTYDRRSIPRKMSTIAIRPPFLTPKV